jgi:hypothetical protein
MNSQPAPRSGADVPSLVALGQDRSDVAVVDADEGSGVAGHHPPGPMTGASRLGRQVTAKSVATMR